MPATDHYWRPLGTMHKVFAVSALALLAATVLMVVKDEDRGWRHYQAEAEELRFKKLEAERAGLETPDYERQKRELEEQAAEAKREYNAQAGERAPQEDELRKLSGEVELAERQSKFQNAVRDVARADYDLAVRDNKPADELEERKRAFDQEQEKSSVLAQELERKKARRDEVKAKLAEFDARREEIAARIKKFEEEQQRIKEQIAQLRPGAVGDWFAAFKRDMKRWPIINGFNPELTLQDKQDWMPELKQQLGMARVARFDRCRACHVHIDRFAGDVPEFPFGEFDEGKYPHPFCSHPRPDVYVTASSPHARDKFGCTICHDGDGSGTGFQTAEHTPADPGQAHHWEEEHSWHSNHFWEYPMLPKQFIESTCLKCHHSVIELGINEKFGPTAPKVFAGYNLIREFGCFGCHEINGFDGARPIGPDLRLEPQTAEEAAKIAADPNQVAGRMRKVGPSLRHVGSKSTGEFLAYWTEEPKRFRPATRMPQFFHLSNQHDDLARQLQPVELAAISAYLLDKSQPLDLLKPEDGYQPNAERGKTLFSQRGCLACHSHDDPAFDGIKSDFGPNLTKVHEKIKDFNWLYTWLRDPVRHHPRTRMPNLFLNAEGEGEARVDPAADIAAFLLQGGPRPFPEIALPGPYLGAHVRKFAESDLRRFGLAEPAGVVVTDVLPGTAATRLIKVAEDGGETPDTLVPDDILVRFGEAGLTSPEQLDALVAATPTGTRVTLTLLRDRSEESRDAFISDPLTDLTRLFLGKSLSLVRLNQAFEQRRYPLPDEAYRPAADGTLPDLRLFIKGDEIELAVQDKDAEVSPEEWEHRKLVYIGRRTISRYGCFGCHDIPGFEEARPIGTALQDWGRKDTSKLALEHIEEYLHHHGEAPLVLNTIDVSTALREKLRELAAPLEHGVQVTDVPRTGTAARAVNRDDGRPNALAPGDIIVSYNGEPVTTPGQLETLSRRAIPGAPLTLGVLRLDADGKAVSNLDLVVRPDGSTTERIAEIAQAAIEDDRGTHEERMAAFFYESLLHHGRPGFLWEKLRDPRSYDFRKTETKGWDERLRMPEFPFDDQQIEQIATFVLGLVADPPPSHYLYQPEGRAHDRIEGERLLEQYNCTACHSLSMPKILVGLSEEILPPPGLSADENQRALDLFLRLRPPRDPHTGEKLKTGEPVIGFHGTIAGRPNPEDDPEDQLWSFDLWEPLSLDGDVYLPFRKIVVPNRQFVGTEPGRGGDLAEWLIPRLATSLFGGDAAKARQAAPPTLWRQGQKVQTPWTYQFLKNPQQVRFTTVLRMPRFNLSDEEAQSLANYFAAVDGVAYPYQLNRRQDPQYLAGKEQEFREKHPEAKGDYLTDSWKLLNAPLCIKCHSLGGREYKVTDPLKDVHAPDLDRVQQRLRPEWAQVWVYRPQWILPYTSMPVNFAANNPQFPELFGADPAEQGEAAVNALMNYARMMEVHGETIYNPPTVATPAAGSGGGE